MNERRLAIMRILDARQKFTARELAERFGVSVRTIQRDLDYLQKLGFPLYTEVGVNGGYRVLPNRILPPLQLNEREAFGLFMMLEFLEKVRDFPYGQIRGFLAEHYFSSLPDDVKETIFQYRNHVTFKSQEVSKPAPFTTEILQTAIEKRAIRMKYDGPSVIKESIVFPIGLYYEKGYWYMPAKKQERTILYRVDRIVSIERLEGVDPALPTLKEWLNQKDERETVQVVLNFTREGKRLAESDPLFQSIKDGMWAGEIPLEELPYLSRQLFALGPEVKVIEPVELQEMVKRRAGELLGLYEE